MALAMTLRVLPPEGVFMDEGDEATEAPMDAEATQGDEDAAATLHIVVV